ncbi:DNA-binding transcriptional LysR family regulator [Rhizobium sp. BIGb0125]|uniref:LysR family transcriptional regulator n=1 Tax=Rhizobium sp. BIGb0125 TaxID=2940618 RepID=UPI00216717EC|nr:LysR family transcriptional regulator [Rhizobium sp. BIGb0125]MCS4245470.1 DNA-binding transcriptional LysR family regulator [Rhizobium sp. BIGb0125]
MTNTTRNDEIIRTVGSLPPGELAAFLAVAEHGGFRAASRSLNQTASALSHAVAGLEKRLKVKLFHRSTRNVSLTEPGRRLSERLMPALAEIGLAVEELHEQASSPSGLVRINCDANAAEQVLVPLLTRFMAQVPTMRFEIRSEGKLVDIAEGGFDCGVRAAELVPDEMVAIPIGPDQQHIVVASPAYLQSAPNVDSPSDLGLHQCIQLRMAGGSIYRWEFQRRGETVVVATTGNLVVDQSRLLLAAALDGCGLAYVTRWMAADALADGSLRQVLYDWTPPYPGLCLYYPRHRHLGTGMRSFLDFMKAEGSRFHEALQTNS